MVEEPDYRETLSKWVSIVSIGGVIAIALIIIVIGAVWHDAELIKLIFSAVLPLFGAWVGTILAFYYGKTNFETASASVRKMAETVGMEKLKGIPVTSEMKARKDMIVEQRPADQLKLIKLTDIKDTMSSNKNPKTNKNIERLPMLDTNDAAIYLIHKSAIDGYMADKALQPSPPDLKILTLGGLLEDPNASDLKNMFEKSFDFVNENATLADAKIKMDSCATCQDVFVTRSGAKSEPVIGWITNNKIQQLAKL